MRRGNGIDLAWLLHCCYDVYLARYSVYDSFKNRKYKKNWLHVFYLFERYVLNIKLFDFLLFFQLLLDFAKFQLMLYQTFSK